MPLLEIYPEDTSLLTQNHMCTQLCIVALLVIAKPWKLPKRPSIGERLPTKHVTYTEGETSNCVEEGRRA